MNNKTNCYLVSYEDMPLCQGMHKVSKVSVDVFACKLKRQIKLENPIYNYLDPDWNDHIGLHDDLVKQTQKKSGQIKFVEEHLRKVLNKGDKMYVMRLRNGTPLDSYYWNDKHHSELFYYYEIVYQGFEYE